MEDILLNTYLPILLGLGVIAFALFTLWKSKKRMASLKIGEKTEGIIFSQETSNIRMNRDPDNLLTIKDKVTVRFVTKKNEWITEDIPSDNAIFYSGQYKPGQKVSVIYDPNDPKNFIVETNQIRSLNILILILGGLALLSYGIFNFLA